MQAPIFLIADYAYADPGGKLHVIGGGVDSLLFPSFPAAVSRLSIAIKLVFDGDDPHREHLVEVALYDETKRDVAPRQKIPVRLASSETNSLLFVWNLQDAILRSPGYYQAALLVDGKTVTEAGFQAAMPTDAPPVQISAAARFTEAYRAVQTGDYDQALPILQDLVADNPDDTDAGIGLGFVLLLSDRPEEALSCFRTVESLGYARRELLLTDIGVTLYRQGKYAEALASFQEALRVSEIRADMLLVQLNGAQMRVVEVKTVPDLFALIALNGAWAAWNLPNVEMTRHLLGLASESSKQGTSREAIVQSLETLTQLLSARNPGSEAT